MVFARLNKLLFAVIAFGVAGPASAIMVNFSVDGTITAANSGNLFGLNSGDTVSMTGTFDSPDLSPDGWVGFNSGSGNSFTITLGSLQLTQSMDIDYSSLFLEVPALEFSSGSLVSTDMIMEFGTNGSPATFNSTGGLGFEGDDGDYGGIWGSWLADTLSIWTGDTGSSGQPGTPIQVPEPGTFLLLGSGLLGLFGFRRRSSRLTR